MENKNLLKALLKIQTELKPLEKTKENPYFKAMYLDLATIVAEVFPLLHQEGILILQPVEMAAGGPVIETQVIHAPSGEMIVSHYPLSPAKPNDPQALGSAITYGRRYALCALLGLIAEADDDGNKASGKTAGQNAQHADAAKTSSQVKQTSHPDGETKFSTFVPHTYNAYPLGKKNKNGADMISYSVKDPEGERYSTLDEKTSVILENACDEKKEIRVAWKINGQYKNIVKVEATQEVAF